MRSASVLSFSPGLLQSNQGVATILMDTMMGKLHKESQRNDQQENGAGKEGGCEPGAARLIEARCLWFIGYRLDLIQVAQILEKIAHRLVTLILITTNCPHYHGSQCW